MFKSSNKEIKRPAYQKHSSYDGGLPMCQVLNQLVKAFASSECPNKNICKQADEQTNTQKGLKFESILQMIGVTLRDNFKID